MDLNASLMAQLTGAQAAPKRPRPGPEPARPARGAAPKGWTLTRVRQTLREATGGSWHPGWTKSTQAAFEGLSRPALTTWVTRFVEEIRYWRDRAARFDADALAAWRAGRIFRHEYVSPELRRWGAGSRWPGECIPGTEPAPAEEATAP